MVQVAIVGGGLSGLALALYLKKYGITTAVYEGRPKDYQAGGHIALPPNALRALDHIGIYEKFRAAGFPSEEIAFMNIRSEKLAKVCNGGERHYNFPNLRVKRLLVHQALLEEAVRQQIPIHFDKKCVGIQSETWDSATVEFEGGETVTADYVIGADGLHSRIRSFVRPGEGPVWQGLAGIAGSCRISELGGVRIDEKTHFPNITFSSNGSIILIPASPDGDVMSFFATWEVPERTKEEWAALNNDKEELSRWMRNGFPADSTWPALVRALSHSTPPESLTLWPFYQVPAGKSWSSPLKRVILIGDSTHGMPPAAGLGGAISFEDSETLGYALGQIYSGDFNTGARAAVIHAWEQHRIPRVSKIIDVATFNGKLRLKSKNFLHQWAREWGLWAMNKILGPKMRSHWIYAYHGESVLADLAGLGRPARGVVAVQRGSIEKDDESLEGAVRRK